MIESFNALESAIIDVVNNEVSQRLTKRIPDIPSLDYRRLFYCLIADRIASYKEAKIKVTLDCVLQEFGITKKAYYNWYEKYNSYYKQCKKSQQEAVSKGNFYPLF